MNDSPPTFPARNRFVAGLVCGLLLSAVICVPVFWTNTLRGGVVRMAMQFGYEPPPPPRKTYPVYPTDSLFAWGKSRFQEDPEDWGGVVSPNHSEWLVRRGLDVQQVAGGFTFPVNIAFAPDPGDDPDAPFLYVNELHGVIKYLTRSGKTGVYADGLINYKPIAQDKTDEMGLSGLIVLPEGDLIVTGVFMDEASGLLMNHVLHLESEPGGRRMKASHVLLDTREITAPAHQIQQALVGPDGKLYVSVGDGENHRFSSDPDKFGGKMLRMNLDGTPCADNPLRDPDHPDAVRNYVYALGIRNIFDFDFDPVGGGLFATENGTKIDRLTRVLPGLAYGWNGFLNSTRINALYSWGPPNNVGPSGVVFLRRDTLGERTRNKLYLGLYGEALVTENNPGRKIVELDLHPVHRLPTSQPQTVLEYRGSDFRTVVGMAEGPDGLYFTDYFGDVTDGTIEGRGTIWKLAVSDATSGLVSPLDQKFAALSPADRGRSYFSRNCMPCHSIGGVGGSEGPNLTRARSALTERLLSKGYEAHVRELLKSEQTFMAGMKPQLEGVLAAAGENRIRQWLEHHLMEPRFDNPRARMPSFSALPPSERGDIIEFIMTLP